jgi:hypothetical protein
VVVLTGTAVNPDPAHPRRQAVIAGHHHTAVAIAAEILRRKEAERPDRRVLPCHLPLAIDAPAGADRLSGVLDDRDAAGRGGDLLERSDLSEEVDRYHGARPRRDRGLDRVGTDVERCRIDIDEHRRCPDVVNRSGGREKGERGRDHLVPSSNVQSAHRDQQRIRSIRTADGVRRPGQFGDRPFEALNRFAENELLAVDDIHHRADDFVANRRVLRAQIEQGYRHW